MVRPLRTEYADAVYHITSLGNERKPGATRISFLNNLRHVKSQRYVARPPLAKPFMEKVVLDKHKSDREIAEAIEKHLYSQREIAVHLSLHYTSVSRIINDTGLMLTVKI
jgi:hypothetical protein